MESDELSEIISLCQTGDKGGFDKLLKAYGPRMYGYFLRAVGSTSEAEDLLQDLFVRLLENIRDYHHEGKFDNWLFRMAANLVRDRARHKGKYISLQWASDDQSERTDIIESTEPGPEQQVERQEEYDRLQQVLRELEPLDRQIIILRHYGKMSFRELAQHFDIPIGTVLAKVHRGLKKLKRILQEDDNG